jgi:hypothetical protein
MKPLVVHTTQRKMVRRVLYADSEEKAKQALEEIMTMRKEKILHR